MNGNFTSDRLEKTDDTESNMNKTSVKMEDVDYACSICKEEFATEVLLFEHYSSVHSEEDNFCKICHLVCSSESIFKIHNSVFHSDPIILHQEGLNPQQSRERVQSSPSDERSRDRSPYACSVCETLFFQLTEHMKEHTNDKPHEPTRCADKIPSTSDVKIYLSKKLRTKMKLAGKASELTIPSNASFKEHHSQSEFRSLSSSNEPPVANTEQVSNDCYDCNVCKAHFLSEDLLVQHLNDLPCGAHHSQSASGLRGMSSPEPVSNVEKGSDPYVCDICEAQFFSEDLLAQHVGEHAKDTQAESKSDSTHVHPRKLKGWKRIKCPFCDKKFSSQYLVKKHLRVHTGEKPFECDTCGRKFSHKSALREHRLRLHDSATESAVADGAEEEDRYKCPQCDGKFPAMTRLKTHLRAQHGVKISFACSSCDSVFTSMSRLKIHYRKCAP